MAVAGSIEIDSIMRTGSVASGSKEMQAAINSLLKTVNNTDKAMRSSLDGYRQAVQKNAAGTRNFYDELQALRDTADQIKGALRGTMVESEDFQFIQSNIREATSELEKYKNERETIANSTSQRIRQSEAYLDEVSARIEKLQNEITQMAAEGADTTEKAEILRTWERQFDIVLEKTDRLKASLDDGSIFRRLDEGIARITGNLEEFEQERQQMLASGSAMVDTQETVELRNQLQVINDQISAMERAAATVPSYQQQMASSLQQGIAAEQAQLDELSQSLEEVRDKQAQLGEAAFGSAEAYDAWAAKVDALPNGLADFASQVEELKARISELDSAIWAGDGWEQMQEESNSLREQLAALQEVAKEASTAFGAERFQEWFKLEASAEGYKTQIEESTKAVADMQAQLDSITPPDLGDTTDIKSGIESAISSATAAIREFGVAIRSGLTSALSGAASIISSSISTLFGVFQQLLPIALKTLGTILSFLKSVGAAALRASVNLAKMVGGAILTGLKKLASSAASVTKEILKLGGNALGSVFKRIGSYVTSAAKSFLHLGNSARQSGHGFNLSFKSIIRYGFGVRSVFALVNKLRSAIISVFESLAKKYPEVNTAISSMVSSLNALKAQLGAAFAPIVTTVAPYITQLLDLLGSAMTQVSKFFAVLMGQNYYYQAKKVQTDYAASLDKTSSSAKKASDATKKTGAAVNKTAKEVEEAENQLASFDHLNILSAPNAKDTSGSGAGAGAAADAANKAAEAAEYAFEKVPLDGVFDWINKIKEAFKNADFQGVGKILADQINGVFERLDELIKWDNVGETITEYINAFCDIVNSLIDNIDWELIGTTVGDGVDTLLNAFNLLLTGIDFRNLGARISDGLNALVNQIDWTLLGETLGNFFGAKLDVMLSIAETFDWVAVGDALGDTLNQFIDTLAGHFEKANYAQIGYNLAAGINALMSKFNWKAVGTFFADRLNDFTTALASAFETLSWADVAYQLAAGINSFIGDVNWGYIGTTLGKGIKGAITSMTWFVENFGWGAAGKAFATTVKNLYKEINGAEVGQLLATTIKGALNFIRNAIKAFKVEDGAEGESLAAKFTNAVNEFFKDESLWALAGETIQDAFEDLLDFTQYFVYNFDAEQMATDIKTLFNGVKWEQLATQVWDIIKEAFRKSGSFLDALFSDDEGSGKKDYVAAKMERITGIQMKSISSGNSSGFAAKIGKKLGDMFNAGVKLITWEDVGTAINDALIAALDFATTLIDSIDIKTLGEGIRTAFGQVNWDVVADKIWGLLKEALLAIVDLTSVLITGKTTDELHGEFAQATYDGILEGIGGGGGWGNKIKESIRGGLHGEELLDAYDFLNLSDIEKQVVLAMDAAFQQTGSVDVDLRTYIDGTADGSGATDKINSAVANANPTVDVGATYNGHENASALAGEVTDAFDAESPWVAPVELTFDGKEPPIIAEENAQAYLDRFKTTILNANGTVKDAYRDSVVAIFGTLDLGAYGIDDAENYLAGWNNGVENGETEAANTLMKAMGFVIDETEDKTLEQGSPSKRAERSGKWYMEGFGIGVDNNKGTLQNTMSTAMDSIVKITDDKWTTAETNQKNTLTNMNTDLDTSMNTMKNTSTSGVQAATKPVYDEWKATIWLVRTALTSINNEVTTAMQTMVNNTNSGMNNLNSAITNGLRNAVSYAQSTTGSWYNVGVAIVQGINNGINSWWGWLNSTVYNLAMSLYNTARWALGIYSPSHVFRDDIGYMVGAGLAEGIDDSQPTVLDSVSSLASDMVNEMQGTEMSADLSIAGDHMLDGLDGILSGFSDKVENSFSSLVSRLDTIASTVAFRVPDVATGAIMPYGVAATAGSSDVSGAVEASANDLASVIIQAANNAALAIVRAIETNGSGSNSDNDVRSRTNEVIAEINRRTRAQGSSPLLI